MKNPLLNYFYFNSGFFDCQNQLAVSLRATNYAKIKKYLAKLLCN